MKLQSIKKGFTLIELLVVITIIGILATGATTVFTSQIQKARDSTRVTDIKALLSWIEQVYQDTSEYPEKGLTFSGVTAYVPKFPTDPKSEQGSASSVFDYLYNVGADGNGVIRQEYELSTTFEQNGNIASKAKPDGGDDDSRLEIGLDIDDTIGTENKPTEVLLTTGILSTVLTMTCVDPTGGTTACTPDWDDVNPMVVRWN